MKKQNIDQIKLKDLKDHNIKETSGVFKVLNDGTIQLLHWVLIEDMLPPEQEDIILLILHSEDTPYIYVASGWYANKTWISHDGIISEDVVAWLPLPDPVTQ